MNGPLAKEREKIIIVLGARKWRKNISKKLVI